MTEKYRLVTRSDFDGLVCGVGGHTPTVRTTVEGRFHPWASPEVT